MAGIPQSFETKMLQFWTGQTAAVLAGGLKMKLVTTPSNDTTQGAEVVNSGAPISTYQEQTIAFKAPTAGAPSQVVNLGAITYTNMPAINGANFIVGIDCHDVTNSQRFLFAGLSANKQTGLGDTISFADASIVATLQ